MGYRSRWLIHDGLMTAHCEVVLHAFDRAVPEDRPLHLLHAGVENGGSLQVWQECLPEGSQVLGIDSNPACADLPVPVVTADVTDSKRVHSVLAGRWFDIIIDSTWTHSDSMWPFLKAGGVLILDGYDEETVFDLVRSVTRDEDSWLPYEEVMSVTMFPRIAVVEKRHPRVVPYIDVLVGSQDPIVPESKFLARGAKRVANAQPKPEDT